MELIKRKLRRIFKEKLTELYFDAYRANEPESKSINDKTEELIEIIEKHLGKI